MAKVKTNTVDADAGIWTDGAISVTDAVEFSGVHRTRLYKLMTQGKIRYVKSDARRLISRRSLVQYLESLD
jgi:excisionase family DNA binding protein